MITIIIIITIAIKKNKNKETHVVNTSITNTPPLLTTDTTPT